MTHNVCRRERLDAAALAEGRGMLAIPTEAGVYGDCE